MTDVPREVWDNFLSYDKTTAKDRGQEHKSDKSYPESGRGFQNSSNEIEACLIEEVNGYEAYTVEKLVKIGGSFSIKKKKRAYFMVVHFMDWSIP